MSTEKNTIYTFLELFDADDRSYIEDFHESSKLVPRGNKSFVRRTNLFMHAAPIRHMVARAWKDYCGYRSIPLPPASLENISLEDALRKRRSLSNQAPAFGATTLTLQKLGSILGLSYGITGIIRGKEPETWEQPLRAAASGGGLYPLEIYPIILQVDGLAAGTYHYSVKDHSLDVLGEGDCREALSRCLPPSETWTTASAVLVVTAVMERSLSKYMQRGYRMIMNDCGALIQNLYLTATGVGAAGCAMAGFYDDLLGEFLKIDNVNEVVAICFAVGGAPTVSRLETAHGVRRILSQ